MRSPFIVELIAIAKYHLKIIAMQEAFTNFLMQLILLTMISLLVYTGTEYVYQPFYKSDVGKVNILICSYGSSSKVMCENHQSKPFQAAPEIRRFNLIGVNIEEYTYPESPPEYALALYAETTKEMIFYDDYAEVQHALSSLESLLLKQSESPVSLRYGNGFARQIFLALISFCLLAIYFLFFVCLIGTVSLFLKLVLRVFS